MQCLKIKRLCVFCTILWKGSMNLAFIPVFKPHAHNLYILRNILPLISNMTLKWDHWRHVTKSVITIVSFICVLRKGLLIAFHMILFWEIHSLSLSLSLTHSHGPHLVIIGISFEFMFQLHFLASFTVTEQLPHLI